MEVYDSATDTWTACPPMAEGRQNVSCCSIQDKIFVIGGSTADGVVGTVECFNTTRGQWVDLRSVTLETHQDIPELPTPRQGAACCVLNDQIYVIGGFTGDDHVATVERLNPFSGKWTTCSPMSVGRSGVGASALESIVYAAGGYDGEDRLDIVETYDYLTDSWSRISPMQICRTGPGVVACQEPVPAVPPHTVEWQMKLFEDAYNGSNMDKASALYAPKCLVMVNGGASQGGFTLKTQAEVADFLSTLQRAAPDGFGATGMKFTITNVHEITHEDTFTAASGKGGCKAVWKQYGNDWLIIKDDITFVPNA